MIMWIATGRTHSVREFLEEAFGYLDLDWKKYVEIDKAIFPPDGSGLSSWVIVPRREKY